MKKLNFFKFNTLDFKNLQKKFDFQKYSSSHKIEKIFKFFENYKHLTQIFLKMF